jgi:hypothetical protein
MKYVQVFPLSLFRNFVCFCVWTPPSHTHAVDVCVCVDKSRQLINTSVSVLCVCVCVCVCVDNTRQSMCVFVC